MYADMLDGLVRLRYAQYGIVPRLLSPALEDRTACMVNVVGTPFRLQIVSDVHLEMCKLDDSSDAEQCLLFATIVKPSAPYLALLGDIGCPAQSRDHARCMYRNFLRYCADRFQHVFLLSGNHEYYVHTTPQSSTAKHPLPPTMAQVDEQIDAFCKTLPNLHYLNRRSLILKGSGHSIQPFIRVIGATLWSHVPVDAIKEVGQRVSDYKQIFVTRTESEIAHGPPRSLNDLLSLLPATLRRFRVDDGNRLHAADLAFIKEQLVLASATNELAIVLTHHAPLVCGTSDPLYEAPTDEKARADWFNPLLHAFATPLDDLFDHKTHPEYNALRLWAFGHTHWCVSAKINNVLLVANQRGYEPDQVNPDYRSDFVASVNHEKK